MSTVEYNQTATLNLNTINSVSLTAYSISIITNDGLNVVIRGEQNKNLLLFLTELTCKMIDAMSVNPDDTNPYVSVYSQPDQDHVIEAMDKTVRAATTFTVDRTANTL